MAYGSAVKQFFTAIIELFKGVNVPGFPFSFFDFFVGVGVVSLSIFIARKLLRIGGSEDD